ncbi:putative cytochrome p450 [Lyophyllum shimeji]|uniref:Cytochrome p450 n=1 Tax=Lyophyllum shimeji TaxID=47721 RepID=A0A9P3PQ36_LYOSH|nr:putative cytochrome p450 [Lyophyllum shimeji]
MLLSIAILAVVVTYLWRRLTARSPLWNIQGPPSPSWAAGHFVDLLHTQDEMGHLEVSWFRRYGSTLRIKKSFGEDVLMSADPKALFHIFHTPGGQLYSRAPEEIIMNESLAGNGVAIHKGATHQRHRRLMNPAFSEGKIKAMVPIMQRVSRQMTEKLLDVVAVQGGLLDLHSFFMCTTLDIICEAAFGHNFGTIEGKEREMATVIEGMLHECNNTNATMRVLGWAMEHVPFAKEILRSIPNKMMDGMHRQQDIMRDAAKKLLEGLGDGTGNTMQSVIMEGSAAAPEGKKLSDDEILSNAVSLVLAGHGTTAVTALWALYELSRRPDLQERIRAEVDETRQRTGELVYDSLPVLNAVLKETLRMDTNFPYVMRIAEADDVIPLSEPIVTADGKTIDSLPVRKGQLIYIPEIGYNRNTSVWGDDADVWNPERWLGDKKAEKKYPLGVYANLMTFSGGAYGCLGWRFAVVEMQVLIVEMLETFVLSPGPRVKRKPGLVVTAQVETQKGHELGMPLHLTPR